MLVSGHGTVAPTGVAEPPAGAEVADHRLVQAALGLAPHVLHRCVDTELCDAKQAGQLSTLAVGPLAIDDDADALGERKVLARLGQLLAERVAHRVQAHLGHFS